MSRTNKGSKKDEILTGKRGRGFPWQMMHDAFTKKAVNKTERRKDKVKVKDVDLSE